LRDYSNHSCDVYLHFGVGDPDGFAQILSKDEGELDTPDRSRKIGHDVPSAPVQQRGPNRLPKLPDAEPCISHN
jgi:hypothetical protein